MKDMKDKKPWYEKLNVWITIVAGIFTIIVGIITIINVKQSNTQSANSVYDNTITADNGDIFFNFGDNYSFERGYSNEDKNLSTAVEESDISAESEMSESETIDQFNGFGKPSEPDDFSLTISYDIDTSQTSLSGIDIMVKAETSFSADHVTISAKSDNDEITGNDIFNMHGGTYEWYFKANFYIKGRYTVTVTAYNSEGECVSDEFTYVY